MSEEKREGIIEPQLEEETSVVIAYKVILFNDDWHTFDEVISQLIKAVNCNFDSARNMAFEVHVKGQAVVFNGEMSKCLKVTSVLEEIGLRTQIVA